MRYFMTFSYDGSDFSGYQKQPKARTVQGEIESVIKKLNKDKDVSVVASGRTDAGVHAMNQKAHFDLNINDQNFDKNSFIFFNVEELKPISTLHYEIIGNINIEKEINIDKNEKLTFKYQQYNNPKEFEATLSKYEEDKKIYSLDFYIKDFIETSLNGAYAYLPKNWAKIRILEDDNTYKLVLNETENVSLYLVGSSPVPHSYSRKIASSSGLSGGAIAGIVIACVVVLIVIGLLFVYFNKPSPKSMDSSAIQFYNSSLSVVN